MSDVPSWKLRRLASRSLRVLERRGQEASALKAFELSLKPKAEAFISAYDTGAKIVFSWRKEMDEGKNAAALLLQQIRTWNPVLQGVVPGFDPKGIGDSPDVPDDILADGETLLGVAMDHKDEQGNALPFLAEIQNSLGSALSAAEKEWSEAEAADKSYQEALALIRNTGDAFQAQLVLFRRVFAAVFGRSDKDYQKLRAERASTADKDDDVPADAPAPALPS